MCSGKSGPSQVSAVGVSQRPYDGAFWQMDILFMRKDRREFQYDGYE
jgi:hypothetical protein